VEETSAIVILWMIIVRPEQTCRGVASGFVQRWWWGFSLCNWKTGKQLNHCKIKSGQTRHGGETYALNMVYTHTHRPTHFQCQIL